MDGAGKKAAGIAVSAVALATLMGAGPAAAEECVICEPTQPGAIDPFEKWTTPPLPGATSDAFGKVAPQIDYVQENVFIKGDLDPGRTTDVFGKI